MRLCTGLRHSERGCAGDAAAQQCRLPSQARRLSGPLPDECGGLSRAPLAVLADDVAGALQLCEGAMGLSAGGLQFGGQQLGGKLGGGHGPGLVGERAADALTKGVGSGEDHAAHDAVRPRPGSGPGRTLCRVSR